MYGPVSTVAGHRGCTQGLLAICVSVCVLYLELQRMGRRLTDERMDGHLQCWAKGAGERSWPFSSHLAPWIMLQEPRVVPLTALLIKILTLWCGYVCAEDLLCKRILAFKWENCSSLLKKTWVTQLQAFLLTVVSVYWAIYTLYPVCLGGCLLQTRVGYNLCCRKTASVCEACRCRMENSMTLLVPSPVAMETIPSIYAPGFLIVGSEGGERQEKPYKRVVKQQMLLNGTLYSRNGNLRKEGVVVFILKSFSRCMPLEGK